jgi:hypothetical protein
MKKYLLSAIAVAALTVTAFAQPQCKGISPASIAGAKNFTWADNWGQTPDFNTPGVFVEGELAWVDDDTPGTNAQGKPLAREGCSPLVNGVDVNGKIAILYRGTCEFGDKAMNAEAAGAIAVIICNRDPDPVGMGAGANGPNVTIPVVMIGSVDCDGLHAAMLNGPVIMFLGNKQGLNANDLATNQGVAMLKPRATNPSLFQNNFTPSIEITNVGSSDQSEVSVNAKITGPTGVVYDETVGPLAMASGEEVFINPANANMFPEFTMVDYPVGEYTFVYDITLGANTDEDPADNTLTSTFEITGNTLSLARVDANGPITNIYPANSTSNYYSCMTLRDSKASLGELASFTFVPDADTSDVTVDLTGEEVYFRIYEWTDTATLDASTISVVYEQPVYLTDNNDVKQAFTAPMASPFTFNDNQLYMICMETENGATIGFGYTSSIDYSGNGAITGIGSAPVNVENAWYADGWTGTSANGLVMEFDGLVGINENAAAVVGVYPNPMSNEVKLQTAEAGNATVVVSDISGKVVMNENVSFANGTVTMNTSKLESGMYIFNIAFANGKVTRANVVKK